MHVKIGAAFSEKSTSGSRMGQRQSQLVLVEAKTLVTMEYAADWPAIGMFAGAIEFRWKFTTCRQDMGEDSNIAFAWLNL